MGDTNILDLVTYASAVDGNEGFDKIRYDLSNPTNSNMATIDTWAGATSLLISGITSAISASLVPFSTFYTNASGSVTAITGSLSSAKNRMDKLATFSGSGQADFNSISGNYTHLVVMGQASVNSATIFANLGCDINGNTGSANYSLFTWTKSGSGVYVSEDASASAVSQIMIATVSGSAFSNYSAPFIGIFPYYSSSSGLYKTGMGLSVMSLIDWAAAGVRGGVYVSASPITRLRFFGNTSGSVRLNLLAGTTISLYGLY